MQTFPGVYCRDRCLTWLPRLWSKKSPDTGRSTSLRTNCSAYGCDDALLSCRTMRIAHRSQGKDLSIKS